MNGRQMDDVEGKGDKGDATFRVVGGEGAGGVGDDGGVVGVAVVIGGSATGHRG